MDVFGWTVQPFINWVAWTMQQLAWIQVGSFIGMGSMAAFLCTAPILIWKIIAQEIRDWRADRHAESSNRRL